MAVFFLGLCFSNEGINLSDEKLYFDFCSAKIGIPIKCWKKWMLLRNGVFQFV